MLTGTVDMLLPRDGLQTDIAAKRIEVQRYILVGSLAVLLWDIILHIPQAFKLFIRYKFKRPSFIIYVIARSSSLAYVLGLTIMKTAPIGHCDNIRRISFLYSVAVPSTDLLLILRLFCFYKNKNKYVVGFFSVSWLFLLGCSVTVPTGIKGVQIGNTLYCMEMASRPRWQKLAAITPLVHNFLVFVATSWAFMTASYQNINVRNGFDVIVLGRNLPEFSKSLLRDGQAYYLATLIFHTTSIALSRSFKPTIMTTTFFLPNLVLSNTMSCYVYRNVHFRLYRDNATNTEAFREGVGNSTLSPDHHQQRQQHVVEFATPARTPRPSVISSVEDHELEELG